MAKIIPFKAVRPTRDKVHLVATRPYYSYTKQILTAKLIENPYTFIHIINPEFRKSDKTEPNTVERFQKVNEKYKEFKADNILIKDEVNSFYVYRQTVNNHAFVGVIAGASVQEYLNGNIKIHEQTLTEREQTFKTYLDVCEFNAEPVLLTHKKSNSLNKLYSTIMNGRAEYEYTTTDKVKHEVWLVQETSVIESLSSEFAKMGSVYIADGHHRSASSALLGCDRKKACGDEKIDASHDYFMAYFISEDLLKIHDFNRLVSNLNGHSVEDIILTLSNRFEVSLPSKKEIIPTNKYQFSMYLAGSWYSLDLIKKPTTSDPLDHLAPQILSDYILEPIFGIKDLKTDPKISFLSGKSGMIGLKRKVDKGLAKIAFGLFPVSVQELMTIADNKEIMPPKSTYIEPKLRSGLTIYEL